MSEEEKPAEGEQKEAPETEVTGIEILDDADFAPTEDFGPMEPEDEEKKDAEDDSSKSSDDTLDGDAGGKGSDANEVDKSGEKSPDESDKLGKDGDKKRDDKDSKKGETEPPETVPYSRFAEVVKHRNETREKLGELSGRLSAIEQSKAAAAEKAKEEEDSEDDDEPFQGTNKEFREAVKAEAAKVAGSGNAKLEENVTRLTLRISEKEAREKYSDYDEIVTESGVLNNMFELAAKGDAGVKSTIAEILADKNPAGRLYETCRTILGKTPPRVDELDPDDWEQVEPTLKKLGLKTTKESWEARRDKKDKPAEKKEKPGSKTLRSAPGGGSGSDGGNNSGGEIDLEEAFPN